MRLPGFWENAAKDENPISQRSRSRRGWTLASDVRCHHLLGEASGDLVSLCAIWWNSRADQAEGFDPSASGPELRLTCILLEVAFNLVDRKAINNSRKTIVLACIDSCTLASQCLASEEFSNSLLASRPSKQALLNKAIIRRGQRARPNKGRREGSTAQPFPMWDALSFLTDEKTKIDCRQASLHLASPWLAIDRQAYLADAFLLILALMGRRQPCALSPIIIGDRLETPPGHASASGHARHDFTSTFFECPHLFLLARMTCDLAQTAGGRKPWIWICLSMAGFQTRVTLNLGRALVKPQSTIRSSGVQALPDRARTVPAT